MDDTDANTSVSASANSAIRQCSTPQGNFDQIQADQMQKRPDPQMQEKLAPLAQDEVDASTVSVHTVHTGIGTDPMDQEQIASGMTKVDSRDSNQRYCWVCFATDEDDETAAWVQPCNCRGTTKWVHQACLQRWVDEKQKGGNMGKVSCPQCQTEYIIVFPNMGVLVLILDTVDSFIYKGCPFLAAGIVVGAIYWCAVTYGAITVMQVVGQREGLAVMEQADPLVLLIGLPAIPIALVVGRMVRWEDTVLYFIRRYLSRIPIIKHMLPFRVDVGPTFTRTGGEEDIPPLSDPVSATRVLCGALLMPTIANIIGKLLFDSVRSNFHKTVLGGATFVLVKGALKIYHKQQQYIRQCQRKILDYTEANISAYLRRHRPSH